MQIHIQTKAEKNFFRQMSSRGAEIYTKDRGNTLGGKNSHTEELKSYHFKTGF